MDVWGASNNHKAYIKKKTSFERMPDWQTNIIEETNYTREGCFDDNFSELSEMEVIFKSGLTDQEFKTVSVTAEEDDIWSSVGLSPDRMFGKKKLNKQEIDNERDYVNIPVAKKNSKCNKTSLSETDINYENEDLKLPPAIPRRQKRRSKVDGDRHIYEEIPFEDDDYEYTDVSDKFGNSTEIASDDDNDDVYELYGFEEETSKGNCKSVISEDVECLYAVVHKRAKTSCLNGTDKQSTNQNKVTNENSENGFLTANRNSCNNIEYSVHLFNGLSSPSNEMDKKDDYVTEKENYEENLYDLIPNDFIENLKQEAHNLDGNNQKESPKSNKSVVLPGASCRGGSVKKPKKAHSEGKHFSRGGSTTRNKLSVWYIEDCIDSQSIKETEKTSPLSSKHRRKETDTKVAIANMANEESNIIILGAEVETSQYVPKDSTLDNEKSSQETGHSDPHTNSLIDFDLMAESNFSLKNHMREQICKDDLVQQYCESLSEVLSTEDIKNQHLNMEQGMKLSSTAESGLGSSDGDALSDRASCDGMDRSSCDGMERASVDDGQNTKNDSNNCKNINLLEMEISLTNTETSGYETPLSPLSPTSVDLSVGQNDAFNRPNIAKQNSQEKVEQRRIENNEKRKSFFGSDSSFDDVMTFEPKLSNTPVTLPSSISPSVSILPKLNDSFPRQQQHSTFTSDYIQRERSSTDSELYNENKTSKIEPRNRSLTESEMEELKKAQALAAEKKSSKFMKQLYYGINSPDAENCEVDENGKPLYEYEYERRHLIGSMKMKKQKRESWINEGNDSNLSDETGTEIKKMVSVKIDKHKEELVPDNQEVTSKLDNNKCNNKRINNIKSGKEPIEKNNSEKQGDQLKPISVQERLELLNLNKESTNGLVNKGKFSRTPVKKKSSQISIENGEKSEVEVVEKEKTNDNKTTQIIEQDSKGQDIENTTICMKAARSMFESKISKTNSEGLKRRQTTPSGEVKNLSVFQSRLSLRKNEAQNEEQKMREKILADINSDDMNVKIIERNHPDLLTDFEDLVDSGGTYMSYDVTETSEAEKIKSETIVEREIRLQREREEEFVRTGSSKLQKPSPQEKEKRQSVAEEQEKEQENIKAHETVVEREIREQKEREAIITRERKRVMGEKQDISRDCLPSSTDRAKPIVDDSSRIMIYGLGMSTNGTPEVRVQRFSGTEEQWSRFKTAPYSSYKEYQKLLRGQSKQGDDATDQPNKAIEESKQESTPTRKAGFLMSSPKSSLAYIHKATNDDSFSLDTVPDVIIRDKQTTEPKRRTLTKKESTIERDIRLTQEREEELAIQKRKTKDLVKHNLTVTDSLEKCPVGKTFSTSSTCSNSSSISSTSSVRGRLASKQKDERKKEDEQKRVIIKSVSKSDVTDEQNESVLKEDKKKVQVKESIIQREIRLQKEREDSIKKEHDRLKARPKSSYQLEVKPQEGDTEASKRRSAPVTDNLTQLQAKKESGHSIKRKSKLALQWEQRLQKQ